MPGDKAMPGTWAEAIEKMNRRRRRLDAAARWGQIISAVVQVASGAAVAAAALKYLGVF